MKSKNLTTKNSFDKVTDTLKKSANYFSIFTVGVASAFVASTAHAANVNVASNVTADDAGGNTYTFNIASKKLTITTDNTTTPDVTDVVLGAITDGSNIITNAIDILSQASDDAAPTFVIASLILDASTSGQDEGAMIIKDIDEAPGAMTVTFSGAFDSPQNIAIVSLEDEDAETLTVDFQGAVTMDDALEVEADASGVTGSVLVKVKAAGIFTGGVDLGSGTDNGDGTSTIEFYGVGTQAIAGAIDGEAANTGAINITNAAGAVTFGGAIGANNAVKSITVGTTTDDSLAEFDGAVSAQTINIQAGETAGEDSSAEFDGAVTGAIVLKPSGGSATIKVIGDTAASVTGAITTTSTDGDDSFVQVFDHDGGAPAVMTFTAAIGTTTNKIGTLQVGGLTSDAGSGNFNGDVNVTNLIVAAGTVTSESSLAAFAGDVNATTVTLNDTSASLQATLELDTTASKTLTATIDGAADNEGILKISGATKTVTGVVGGTFDLDALDLDATSVFNSAVSAKGANLAAGVATTMKGDITMGTDKFVLADATAELIIGGTAAQTITGEIAGAGAETGVIDVTNTAGVTFATALGANELKEFEADASTTVTFESTIKSALIDMDGTRMTIQAKENVANRLTIADGSILVIDDTIVADDEVFQTGAAQVDNDIISGSIIKLPANLLNGEAIIFLAGTTDAADAAIVVDVQEAVADNAIMTYTVDAVNNGTNDEDIRITATSRSSSAIATQLGTTKNDGAAMSAAAIAVEGDATLLDIFSNVLTEEGSMSATADTDLAKQVAPQQDLIVGSTVAAKAMTGAVQGVISNRMASLRSGDAYVAGMSAGENLSANSMFLQAFGSVVEQDDKIVGQGHQSGYDADTSGVAFGIDSITNGGTVIGLSVSMSNTDLEGKGTGKATNDIDSYTASLYMDKTGDAGYLEGSVTFGISENAAARTISTAGIARSYKGVYDNQQISVKLGGGLPYEASNGAYVTPFVSVTGTLIESDAYTEVSDTAADVLRLRVDQDDVNSIVGTVGIKAHYDTGKGVPMFSLALNNEFGDKDMVTTNTFQGAGAAFKTTTAIEELSATLGLGYTFTNGNTDVNVGYEAEANDDDYLGHYGTVKLTTKF
jgi:uncharacterized protein with beta-barrel porin domain